MKFPYEEFDLSGLRTYPLATRESKAKRDDFGRPYRRGSGIVGLIGSLPNILGASDFREVVRSILDAHAHSRGIVWGLGAHVIKTGLSPIVIDLMKRGFMSAIATNGAGLIHDFEVAISGSTSENVENTLEGGLFGFSEETGGQLNAAINDGVRRGLGIGQAVGEYLAMSDPTYGDLSITATAAQLEIPLTVHVAIGTDVIHMHPSASGSALGEGSLRDFRYFVSNVARLERGVYLNCGSAVILPEVFLKAIALSRNRGATFEGLTTVNLDFLRLYRPQTNVVARPTMRSGRGFSLVGHHEILIPLLAAALIENS
ncbi:MAG: hypothetical protein HY654_03735 [Acidobacteria bacterium]|nr:hypothetical protein [Acidobacteriota bacterium]